MISLPHYMWAKNNNARLKLLQLESIPLGQYFKEDFKVNTQIKPKYVSL